jgi:uncharacterized protein
MILHIERLQRPLELCVDVDHQQCDLPLDLGRFIAPIHLDAHVRKVEEEITIEGRISTHIEMTCSRCLKPHDEYIDDMFEVVYCPKPDEQEAVDEIELNETDLNASYYEGGSIAVSELIREQLLLLLPIKPLCKADCAGLCPSCGKDLNEGPCNCSADNFDPRFAALRQLLHTNESDK